MQMHNPRVCGRTMPMRTAWRLTSTASGTGKPWSDSAFMKANSLSAARRLRYSQLVCALAPLRR